MKWRRRPSPIGRRLRWLGATLLALEIAYLVFGNLFLRFGLQRVVNTSPEKVLLEYESAYSLWPGVASVHRFRLRSEDRGLQWLLEVERADVTVELLALFGRTFHASRIRADGVSLRLRRRLTDAGAAEPRSGALPPIEGFEDPGLLPIGPPPPPVTDADYANFTVLLEDTDASVREIWVDELRLLGPAHVSGRGALRVAERVEHGRGSRAGTARHR